LAVVVLFFGPPCMLAKRLRRSASVPKQRVCVTQKHRKQLNIYGCRRAAISHKRSPTINHKRRGFDRRSGVIIDSWVLDRCWLPCNFNETVHLRRARAG